MKSRIPYPTDLSDAAWDVLQPLVPTAKPVGRPEKYPKRDILDGIFLHMGIAKAPLCNQYGSMMSITYIL
jgi:transposase